MRQAIAAVLLCFGCVASAHAQNDAKPNGDSIKDNDEKVVLSGRVTTVRLADPNTPVVFNGYVMRVADFLAVVSASSEVARHLRTPETQNHETVPQVPPSKPLN
ncbi:hypothetical protein [Acidicapsa acidisoli]|uniref:hypothetical protein n=1 Tax=Acidicapsa acidisoli TaxID=1615681 RepID=UPI0021DF87E3|nr:hypothetical protein [Acidicapsa acidisoli]